MHRRWRKIGVGGGSAPPQPQARLPGGLLFFAVLGVVGTVAAGALLWLSRDGEETFSGVPAADPGPVHVHAPLR